SFADKARFALQESVVTPSAVAMRVDKTCGDGKIREHPQKVLQEKRLTEVRGSDEVNVRREVVHQLREVKTAGVGAAAEERLASEICLGMPQGIFIRGHLPAPSPSSPASMKS